jgi:hypothetical protein
MVRFAAVVIVLGMAAQPPGARLSRPRPTALAARVAGAPAPTAVAWPLGADCTHPVANPGLARVPANDEDAGVTGLGEGIEVRRLYAVHDDAISPIDGIPVSRTCDAALWRLLQSAIPPSIRRYVTELLLFDGDDASPQGPLLGEVQPLRDDPARWRLGLRLDATSSEELLLTIAHEVGHLISLNVEETAPSFTAAQCHTYVSVTGCLRGSAILTRFVYDEWSQAMYDEWSSIDAIGDDRARQEELDTFYAKHRTDFVDPYAVTAPEEDFAETYAYWCVHGVTGGRTGGAAGDGEAKRRYLQEQVDLRLLTRDSCTVLRRLAG